MNNSTLQTKVYLFMLLITTGCVQPKTIRPTTTKRFPIEEATIIELQALMQNGKMTSRQLCEDYLARIGAVDRAGPTLRSILELNPEVLQLADALDREREEKGPRGPLHGIPILLKDNIDTADQMQTTAGSLALIGSKPARDAFLVQRLRAAGAVILGKTNLSEWDNFRSRTSSSGWSARGGQTKNPYILDRSPSGSSSGSAAAISANLASAAVGTETDGSIVSPSSVCGIVGIKPTVGLISRAGIIPISHTQDTAGPMTRTVADAAILLGVMAGIDPLDEKTNQSQGRGRASPDYTKFLDKKGLYSARIGVIRKGGGVQSLGPKLDPILEDSLSVMKKHGAILVDVELPSLDEIRTNEFSVLLYDLKIALATYLKARPNTKVKTLAELITFNQQNAAKEMSFFRQELFELAQNTTQSDQEYTEAKQKSQEMMREAIDKVLDENHLDVLIAITNGPAWSIDLVNGDYFTGGTSSIAAVSGYPSITVPAGFIQGLPVGLSFFGRAYSESTLLKLSYSFEQATKARKAPSFLATVKE